MKLGCLRHYFIKNKKNEKSYPLVSQSACNRSINHFNHSPYGWYCLFLGRNFEICVCKSGGWTIYKVRLSLSRNDRTYNRNRRNYWWFTLNLWIIYKDYSFLF